MLRHLYIFRTLAAAASLMLVACNVLDVYENQASENVVGIHLSKADGAASGGEYAIRLWFENNVNGIMDSWGMFLDPNTSPLAEGNVDYYNFGSHNLPVVDADGNPLAYPADGSSICAIGHYPSGKILSGSTGENADWQELTIKPTEGDMLTRPGLVDVCVTDVEKGNEAAPFTMSEDNELRYRHTQVKLNFQYMRSTNLNGRIAEIWVTFPQNVVANKWTFNEGPDGTGTYVPSAEYQTESMMQSIIMTSSEDWYNESGGQVYNMYYSYFLDPDNPADYRTTSMNECYVLPSETLFGLKEIEVDGVMTGVQHITFKLDAVIISSDKNIPNTRLNGYVSAPLRNKEDKSMWTETVKAGDAFTILIIIEQNRLVLLAEKGTWDKGGYITVPLNPNNPNE